MATDKQISALTALTTPADGDLFPIVDVSDTTDASSGTTKKIAVSSFFPSSSTDNAIARYESTTGKLLQNSGVIVDDSNNVYVPGTLDLGHATQNTLSASGGVLSIEGVVIPSISSTSTLTNKRITQRVVSTTDDATAVIDVDVTDVYVLTAVANATVFTLTGTPTSGQKLLVQFKDAGVAKGLTWTGFTAIGVTLPTTTVASKQHYVGCVYNGAATRWEAIAVGVEA